MHKLLHTLAMAALVAALPLVASADTNLNLDTGAKSSAGGDLTFNGTSIAPVASAQFSSLGTTFASEFSILFGSSAYESILASFTYAATPISGSSLVVNEVFAVHTNSGNYAGVLVTAVSSTSITLQYYTYNAVPTQVQAGTATLTATSGPAPPSVTMVQNNYSYILPNAPNYGIAPGTLFIVVGTDMATPGSSATPLQDPSNALPDTLHGSSVSVTVGGTTVHPVFYYAIPTQLALVLPSSTPTGNGTLTVTYGGQTSQPAPIKVVPSAFGFGFYGGTVALATQNNTANLITSSSSAFPGEYVVFWGSGDGADTNNDDVNKPTHFDNLSGLTAIYLGTVSAPILYQGRSGYQGLDQVVIQIPDNAPLGCAVSVVGLIGSGASAIATNNITMAIAANGGQCSDPISFVSPTEASTLSGQATVKFGGLSIDKSTTASGTTDEAGAFFYSISGSSLTGYQSSSQPSLGSCFVTQSNSTVPTNPFTLTGLDAGSVSVTGPNGTVALQTIPQVPGIYIASSPPNGTFTIPAGGGAFTFTGTGGADVGAFSAGVDFPNPLVWTNSGSDGTVTRTQGVTVNWTGGASGTFVQISGESATTGFSASFVCDAPVSAQTFTVPIPVLLALPAGSGGLTVSNYTNPVSVHIPGVDFGYAMAFVSTAISATYN